MTHVIQTENLTKHYGDVHAVEKINLNVKQGEIYGFLGLNGAGKTTSIRMLLGMIRPTGGMAKLFGQQVGSGSNELWNKVGHMVEIPYAYPELTVQENLEIFYRLRYQKDQTLLTGVMEKLEIARYRNIKVKNLSLGNAQRLGLAKAMIHRPSLLILDEPTNGLDPAGIVQVREMLLNLAQNAGVTIFISSHILGEISRFASRIGIIHEGEMIRELETHHLDMSRNRTVSLNTLNNQQAVEILKTGGYDPETMGGTIEISQQLALEHPEQVTALLAKKGLPPTSIVVNEEDLEHYFLRIIQTSNQKQTQA